MERTVAELAALEADLVMPTHCSGFEAQRRMAAAMPKSFALNSVGTRIMLPPIKAEAQ